MPTIPYVIDTILWLLAVFSFVTWTILIVKVVAMTRLRRVNDSFVAAFANVTNVKQLRAALRGARGTFADIANVALTELRSFADDEILTTESRGDLLRQSLAQERRAIQIRLEGGLALLASIGSVSPIMGLLGTVWSIMNLLKSIAGHQATGLDVVAGPIGDALITTAVGIMVAIPALLGYSLFLRRIRVAAAEMERFCERLQQLAIRWGYRAD